MNVSKIFGKTSPKVLSDAQFDGLVKQYVEYAGGKLLTNEILSLVKKYNSCFKVPTIIGIEIEVENCKELPLPSFWMQEGDGSLRNGGKEFKSQPLTPSQAFIALALLWQIMSKSGGKPEFSWRTSIHIHINVLELDSEEVKRLLLLSMIFENLFFSIVGSDREQSNFCVPLTRSSILPHVRTFVMGGTLNALSKYWNAGGSDHPMGLFKYAAVNLTRLSDLGTVEFRHLGGTNQLSLVLLWLAVLLKVYQAAISMTTQEIISKVLELNNTRKYEKFMQDVFGTDLAKALTVSDYEALFETLTKVKELFVMYPKYEGVSKDSALVAYAKYAHERRKKEGPPVKK